MWIPQPSSLFLERNLVRDILLLPSCQHVNNFVLLCQLIVGLKTGHTRQSKHVPESTNLQPDETGAAKKGKTGSARDRFEITYSFINSKILSPDLSLKSNANSPSLKNERYVKTAFTTFWSLEACSHRETFVHQPEVFHCSVQGPPHMKKKFNR